MNSSSQLSVNFAPASQSGCCTQPVLSYFRTQNAFQSGRTHGLLATRMPCRHRWPLAFLRVAALCTLQLRSAWNAIIVCFKRHGPLEPQIKTRIRFLSVRSPCRRMRFGHHTTGEQPDQDPAVSAGGVQRVPQHDRQPGQPNERHQPRALGSRHASGSKKFNSPAAETDFSDIETCVWV